MSAAAVELCISLGLGVMNVSGTAALAWFGVDTPLDASNSSDTDEIGDVGNEQSRRSALRLSSWSAYSCRSSNRT
jgi:hypothetical protein